MKIMGFISIYGALLMVAVWYANLPIVVFSNATGECNTVLSNDNYSCANMPEKYTTEWSR